MKQSGNGTVITDWDAKMPTKQSFHVTQRTQRTQRWTIAEQYIGAYAAGPKKIRMKSGYPDLAWKNKPKNLDLPKWNGSYANTRCGPLAVCRWQSQPNSTMFRQSRLEIWPHFCFFLLLSQPRCSPLLTWAPVETGNACLCPEIK